MTPHRPGMTLLELVVVLAIGGMVLAVGYATFASTIDRRAQAARATADGARIAGVRRALASWLDGARPQLPQAGTTDPRSAGELRAITRASTPLGALQTTLRLYVDHKSIGRGDGLIAVLRPIAGMDSLRLVLDSSARALSVEYLVALGGRRTWLPPAEAEAGTPLAVRIRIESDDPVAAAAFALPIEAPTAHAR
jgi:prepilin-type N-terminal cleavage/methylation domain-containing protein